MFCCKLDVFPGHIRTLKSFAYEHKRAGWRNASASPGTQHLPNEGHRNSKGYDSTSTKQDAVLWLEPATHFILSSGLLNPPRRFMYWRQVLIFLIFTEPSWLPSTCFPLVDPKPERPMVAIMASSSAVETSISSPSSGVSFESWSGFEMDTCGDCFRSGTSSLLRCSS